MTNGAAALDPGGRQQRLVLASFVMHANEFVSADRILDTLWDDDPPPTSHETLQGCISSLRKAIGDDVIQTTATAYRLNVKRT